MFGISHQKAGLNWPGRYKAWSRERALADAWRAWVQRKGRTGVGCGVSGVGNNGAEHAKWRRITGITGAVEQRMTAKERRKGLKRLVDRIRAFATEDTENTEKGKGLGFRVQGLGNDDPLCRSSGDERHLPLTKGEKTETELSLMTPFGRAAEEWAGPRNEGRSVESMCAELEISRARLTMLTKEYCGVTAQELADGFKIGRVKRALIERLREAAESLWGLPGTWAAWKMDGFRASGFGFRGNGTTKRSKYFRMRPEDYAAEERCDERARRIEELVSALRRGSDLEDWAARAGFGSGARLKRACLNVLGRSLRAIERGLAAEVVRYYICAEDKVLREVASREAETPNVIRARWIYGKSDDPPSEPFLDEWSKAEALARDWLDRMREAFGCVT